MFGAYSFGFGGTIGFITGGITSGFSIGSRVEMGSVSFLTVVLSTGTGVGGTIIGASSYPGTYHVYSGPGAPLPTI